MQRTEHSLSCDLAHPQRRRTGVGWKLLPWLATAAVLAGCAPEHRGALEPIAGPGVVLVSAHGLPHDAVRLSGGGVTANVTGRWSDEGESVEVEYRSGPTPVRVAIASVSFLDGRVARATAAWDRSAPVPGNAIGRPLPANGALDVRPGERKLVQIKYGRPSTGDRPVIGDVVSITIPMPGRAHAVRFRVAGE